METSHTQIIMWIVGTGLIVIGLFIGIMKAGLEKKVETKMCDKIHMILDEKLSELSADAKETIDKIHKMSLAIENVRGMLEGQIKTEAGRWDRTLLDKKG